MKPAIVPKVGHEDGHGGTGHSGNGHHVPSNGHIPRRRPSFPYAPGYDPEVVSDACGRLPIHDANTFIFI